MGGFSLVPATDSPTARQSTMKATAACLLLLLVVSLGSINFIPGLPIKPAYYKIDLDLSTRRVVGLS